MLTLKVAQHGVHQQVIRHKHVGLLPFGAFFKDLTSSRMGWNLDGCFVPIEWPPSWAYLSRILSKKG